MQKLFLILFFLYVSGATAIAQQTSTYAVVVSFGSMCCGVPSGEPVKKLIKKFKKQYKIKQVAVDSIGPMGREGEYYLAFRLQEFSKAQKIKFIRQLKKTTAGMTEQGSAEIKENLTVNKADLSPRTSITLIKL